MNRFIGLSLHRSRPSHLTLQILHSDVTIHSQKGTSWHRIALDRQDGSDLELLRLFITLANNDGVCQARLH